MVTSVNRCRAIYERELAIRLVLVDNTDKLIYLNGSTDPYTNSNGSTMLGQNQTNIENVIGSANYDIGHVFSTGGGGIAGARRGLRNGQQRLAASPGRQPVGDPYDVDYVIHEMGHQFGANHPFDGTAVSVREPKFHHRLRAGQRIDHHGVCRHLQADDLRAPQRRLFSHNQL